MYVYVYMYVYERVQGNICYETGSISVVLVFILFINIYANWWKLMCKIGFSVFGINAQACMHACMHAHNSLANNPYRTSYVRHLYK